MPDNDPMRGLFAITSYVSVRELAFVVLNAVSRCPVGWMSRLDQERLEEAARVIRRRLDEAEGRPAPEKDAAKTAAGRAADVR